MEKNELIKIVVSRYDEDLEWLRNTNHPYIVYNKGIQNIDFENICLENDGRESHTYLTYIVDNYYNLPEIIVLLQGNPYGHHNSVMDVINNYISSNNVDNIEYLGRVCDDTFAGNWVLQRIINYFPDFESHFTKTWNRTFLFSQGAQYIVPKKFILNKSFDFWKQMLHIHNFEGQPWPSGPSGGAKDENPWEFERIWHLIFLYSTH